MSDGEVSIDDINKKLTKGDDLRGDALLMMEPYKNWEEKIVPAPYAIAVLGQLIAISSMRDFSLATPIDGFKYVRWPNFRANLVQISSEGYKAFNLAHSAMDRIKNETGMVPNYMIDAVSILMKGSDFDVKQTLPTILKNIEGIAKDCKKLSKKVATKFQDVMNIIFELQQSCVQTGSNSVNKLSELELEKKLQKQKQEHLKENEKKFQQQYDNVNAILEKCQKQYDDAVKKMPSNREILLYNLIDSSTKALFCAIPYFAVGRFAFCGTLLETVAGSFSTSQKEAKHQQTKTKSQQRYEDPALCYIGAKLKDPVMDLSLFFNDFNELKKVTVKSELEDKIKANKHFLENHLKDAMSHDSSPMKEDICIACTEALECYKCIEHGGNVDSSTLKEKVASVSDKTMKIDAQCSHALNQDLLDSQPLFKRRQNKSEDQISTSQQAVKNAHFKIEEAVQRLSEVEKKFAVAQDNMLKNSEELTKVLNKIAEFNAAEATANDVQKVLKDGLGQLGQLQEQWSQLSLFFDHITNLIQTNLNKNMRKFVQHTDDAKNSLEGDPLIQALREIMYKTTFTAVKYSYLVNHLSLDTSKSPMNI